MLATSKAVQIKKYKQFVEESDAEDLISFFEKTNLPSMLGGKKFVEWIKEKFFTGKIDKEIPQSRALAPDTATVRKAVCGFYHVSERELTAVRRGVENEPRDMAIYLMRTVCGEPLMRIGSEFGMESYSSVSSAVGRIRKKLPDDQKLGQRHSQIWELLKKRQTKT